MKRFMAILLLACMLCGCAAYAEQSPAPAATQETAVQPSTEAAEAFVQQEVELDAVNKLAFQKSNARPSVAVFDHRTAAFLTRAYQNKDYSVPYTNIRLMDLHMDAVRKEVLLEGAFSVMAHCSSTEWIALAQKENDRILVLDRELDTVLDFQTRGLDGVITPALDCYYYIWGSRLYCQNVATGESSLFEGQQELLLDEILGYDPQENILLVSAFEDNFTVELCMGAIDLDDGTFALLYRDVAAGNMSGTGICLEDLHVEQMYSDVYFGDWQDQTLRMLPGFLVNNVDYASWHIAGSDYLCKFTYDAAQKVDIVDFQLFRLGDNVEVCSLQEHLKGAKINEIFALPNGDLLALAISARGYQVYLICPEQLEFSAAELEIRDGTALVDASILEHYDAEEITALPENLADVRAQADVLEQTYGVTILISSQCDLAASYCEMPITTTDEAGFYNEGASIEAALRSLEAVLKLYPSDFFRQFRNEADQRGLLILLVEDIASELNTIGVSYGMGQWYPIAVDITSGEVQKTLCHEIWHATENRINDVDVYALDTDAWDDCNPVGFSYAGTATPEYMKDTQYTFFYGNPGEDVYFVDPYGKTKPQEDRARLMEYIMCEDAHSEKMLEHPAIREKLQILCDAIREAFDTSTWETVHWERFF